ncbi:MAG TPA: sigma-54 dependent transcriptional regulator [Longimicrobiales bacterium]|nr:sigma-54 dependent transcriptional regulator [Longimicrobiales bacterium]
MANTIAITTQDLEPAVHLRDAFLEHGFDVELLTAGERLADARDPVLLVLTGGLDEKRARRLLREADERGGLPVIGLADAPQDALPDACRRRGITECLAKPFDVQEVVLLGRRLVERRRLRRETGIIGDSEVMSEVLERVVQMAPVNATVLISGESGTGKELVARGLHALSTRSRGPFIAANVAALSDTLLESELFGHEKGSFTGAVAQRKGLFELADRGTLFLDEIGEMPLVTQTKLLRVLEEKRFYRVGGEEPLRVDVRVVTATNQDPRRLVDQGGFRRDLYYRLQVLQITLPPLRERRSDIPQLIEAFARAASREHDRPAVTFELAAIDALVAYDWPGNVRELRNLVETVVVLASGRSVIRLDDIPENIRTRGASERRALPVPIARATTMREGAAPAPELEFIFRTLLEMRMDMEELRREFEQYRRTAPRLTGGVELPYPYPYPPSLVDTMPVGEAIPSASRSGRDLSAEGEEDDDDEDEGVVVYRPGMRMEDIERAAIIASLERVGGNRRRAAEDLGIGERTLYRKIKQYGIPL